VAAILMAMTAHGQISGWVVLPALIILCREILVSGLREYLAELKVRLPVSMLAKWKTTMQMVAVGFLIVGDVSPGWPWQVIGEGLMWLAAALTLLTGYDYFRVGIKHMTEDDRADAKK
jgi:cardiolipin synthase